MGHMESRWVSGTVVGHSGARLPGFEPASPAARICKSLVSLCLYFLICKMEPTIVPTSEDGSEVSLSNAYKTFRQILRAQTVSSVSAVVFEEVRT